jgi:hypothetical protein
MYNQEKKQVDKLNKVVNDEIVLLKTMEIALGGREALKNYIENIAEAKMKTSLIDAFKAGGMNAVTQIKDTELKEIVNSITKQEPNLVENMLVDPKGTSKKVVEILKNQKIKINLNELNLKEVLVAATYGSLKTSWDSNEKINVRRVKTEERNPRTHTGQKRKDDKIKLLNKQEKANNVFDKTKTFMETLTNNIFED